ncbi:ABC transporter substrate-binding protein [Myroides pelagicus]|uniref:ABC transporter substrate-binding protein n=2 Tax=Myroides pelagicus TaxID=270914 RepID=A0A7K1GS92_9FLAO|nr:ABC transporter substrate-binding protein [Myroides pelagicus]
MKYWKAFLAVILASQVSFAQSEDRIVIFGQQALEMVKEFGGKQKVVGVGYLDQRVKDGTYSDWPILTSLWPSIESIIATAPTHLFGMESAFKSKRSGSRAFWSDKGVAVTEVFDFNKPRTLEVLFSDLRTFGKVFKREKQVDEYIKKEYKKLQDLKKTIVPSKEGQAKRVLFLANVYSSDIYYSYTPDKCLIGDLLQDFDVEFLHSEYMVIPVSIEYLVTLNPDYIILSSFQAQAPADLLNYFKQHKVLRQLDAVQNNRLTTVDYSNAVSGGLEFVRLYQQLVSFLQ